MSDNSSFLTKVRKSCPFFVAGVTLFYLIMFGFYFNFLCCVLIVLKDFTDVV
jgi:hypothetical protein